MSGSSSGCARRDPTCSCREISSSAFRARSDADFDATMDLSSGEVGYGQAYSFKYSARPGTPAMERKGQVAEDIKSDRLQRLQTLLSEQQAAAQEAMVGRTVSVLFEKTGRMDGQLVGKSDHLQAVHAAAEPADVGRIRPVRIVAAMPNSLSGELA